MASNPKKSAYGKGDPGSDKSLWKLKKHFRDSFCVLKALRDFTPFRDYFQINYLPSGESVRILGTPAHLGYYAPPHTISEYDNIRNFCVVSI